MSSSLVIFPTWLPTESFTHLCSYWTLYLVVVTTSVSYGRVLTPISISPLKPLETSVWSNSSYTTETLSISYSSFLYIRLVVILQLTSLIINKDNSYWTWSLVFNGDIPISTHFYLGLLSFIWSCNHPVVRQHSI